VYFYHVLFVTINICGIDCQKKLYNVELSLLFWFLNECQELYLFMEE
jgi:hypothetical protein